MGDNRPTAEQRRNVAARAHYLCEYCRCPDDHALQSFALDHIVPISRGGTTTDDNLAYSCQGCNSRKYNKTEGWDPLGNETAPLFNPRQDIWQSHFAWSNDGLRLIGLSPCGRTTIHALALNRTAVVNMRGLLSLVGRHPPPKK